jgi:hypothetical protein
MDPIEYLYTKKGAVSFISDIPLKEKLMIVNETN